MRLKRLQILPQISCYLALNRVKSHCWNRVWDIWKRVLLRCLQYLPKFTVFSRDPPLLVDRRVVIISRQISLVARCGSQFEIGPGVKIEICPAVNHIHVEWSLVVYQVLQLSRRVLNWFSHPGLPPSIKKTPLPVIQPSGVGFAAQNRHIRGHIIGDLVVGRGQSGV